MKPKTSIKIIAALALASPTVYADLTFTAPSMATPHVATQLEKNWTTDLGHHWRYIVTGYSYSLNAAVPNGGKVSANTLLYQRGNTIFPGFTQVSASIMGLPILSDSLSTSYLHGTTGLVSHTFNSPIVIENKTISATFNYSTNMVGGADFITIYGSALKAPPIPVGSLTAPSYVRYGGLPTLAWFISKSLGNETTTEQPPTGTVTTDAPNSGSGKTDSGHGNNIDGIDSSNPGKAAAVWAARGSLDTDYNNNGIIEDDEAGTYISQTPVE